MTEQQPSDELATIPTEDGAAFVPNGPGDLDVVKIYNEELEAYGESPRAGVPFLSGWEVVDPTPEVAAQVTSYDPGKHSVAEVVEYFQTAAVGEVEAIKALEGAEDGKGRTTILNWEPAPADSDES
jgi:hypothetical protein